MHAQASFRVIHILELCAAEGCVRAPHHNEAALVEHSIVEGGPAGVPHAYYSPPCTPDIVIEPVHPDSQTLGYRRTANHYSTLLVVAVPRYPTNTPPIRNNQAQLLQL